LILILCAARVLCAL